MNNLHFTDFDYVILGVMGFSCIFAFFRGLVREILSLAAWIGAGVVTIYYFPSAAENLKQHFKSSAVAAGIAGIGIYLLALLGFGLLNTIIIKSFKSSGESGTLDNLLGLIFGAVRGALMISLGFFLLTTVLPESEYPPWLSQAVTLPYVKQGAMLLARVAPDAMRDLSALENEAEGGIRGNMPPAALPVQQAAPAPVDANPISGASGDGQDSGYSRTTTQQLDRLIQSTGSGQ